MAPRNRRQSGFALLPVVLTLTLLAAVAFVMTREGATETALAADAARIDEAGYVAEAGLRHALWLANQSGCTGYNLPPTPFGSGGYSASYSPSDGSPVEVVATGTLASGATSTLARAGMKVYDTVSFAEVLRPGAAGEDAYVWDGAHKNKNFGATPVVQVNNASAPQHALLRFDLSSVPAGARLVSAGLGLYLEWGVSLFNGQFDVHRVTRTWIEGDQDDQTTTLGVTFQEAQLGTAWTTPGGDYDPTPAASLTLPGWVIGWQAWDVSGLVDGWLRGAYPNDGLLIRASAGTVNKIEFTSGDSASSMQHPVLALSYTCECGTACSVGQLPPTIILSTESAATLGGLSFSDKDLAEYDTGSDSATLYLDGAAVGLASDIDAVHVLANGHLVLSTIGTATLGGQSFENEDLVDYDPVNDLATLFFDGSEKFTAGSTDISAVHVMDNGHMLLTNEYAATLGGQSFGPNDILDYDPATDTASLFLDGDAVGFTGWINAVHLLGNGHIVLSTNASETLGGLSFDEGDLVEYDPGLDSASLYFFGGLFSGAENVRSVHIGAGSGVLAPPSVPQNLLFIVGNDTNLTLEETTHQTLIESWGYIVELIDDDASPAEFDTAAANNDVAFATNDITASRLSTKLVDAAIGVVTSEDNLSDEFGLSSSIAWDSGSVVEINDNTHYITSPFALGILTILSSSESLAYVTGTLSPDLGQLASSTSGYGVVTLEAGGSMSGGGPAAGRRVQLPWGGNGFDPNNLDADGLTILQRALEWGTGAGPQIVLLVVPDAGSLGPQDTVKKTLIESWGYIVALISAADPQADFDAAVLSADVAYISEEIQSGDLGTKLRDTTIGVVTDETALSDEFGLAPTGENYFATDIEIVDNAHYISQPFANGALTILSSLQELKRLTGSLAPGLDVLAEDSGLATLVAIDEGGALFDSGTAAGRRVQLPWGPDAFDINALNTDGLTIMRRAIEWGAESPGGGGGGGGGGGPTIVEVTVATGNDDAEELVSSGSVNLTSSDLELVFDGSNDQLVGIRFAGVSVPPGATISNAYIQFQVDETNTGATSVNIEIEDSDDAATFTSSTNNISNRPTAPLSVPWVPPVWSTVGERGPDERTPDISSLIQVVVDRAGWSSGNAMVVIITGTGERTAESYNGSASGAAMLHIEY